MKRRPPEFVEIDGQQYQYSPCDGAYYPVPTQDEYDFERFIIFISTILLVSYICYLIIER